MLNSDYMIRYEQLINHLDTLGVSYVISGSSSQLLYCFKSTRSTGDGGIYFFQRKNDINPDVNNSIVFSKDDFYTGFGNVFIKVDNPQLVYYKLMRSIIPLRKLACGVHPTAIVDDNSIISKFAYVGPYCVLEDCVIKDGVYLHSHVTVMPGVVIENDVVVESHSTIGATGVAWVWDKEANCRVMQPQIGFTKIGAGVFLGSDVTIVRGSINETTIIGDGCVIAHGSKIGHGSIIGKECHLANNVSIAGNVTLGCRCFLGSGSVIRPQIIIGDEVTVGAGAVVVENFDIKRGLLVGVPAKPAVINVNKMAGVPESIGLRE